MLFLARHLFAEGYIRTRGQSSSTLRVQKFTQWSVIYCISCCDVHTDPVKLNTIVHDNISCLLTTFLRCPDKRNLIGHSNEYECEWITNMATNWPPDPANAFREINVKQKAFWAYILQTAYKLINIRARPLASEFTDIIHHFI